MKSKKGIELSLNFIVLLILGMAMLAGALVLSTKMFSKAKDYQSSVDQNTQDEIKRLITDTDSLVVIYPARKTINRKSSSTFGVGVQNLRTDTQTSDDKFSVSVSFDKAYDKTNKEILNSPKLDFDKWINTGKSTEKIKKNELYTFPVLITVPKNTKSGVYLFNTRVCRDIDSDNNPLICNLGVQEKDLYDNSLHKIYVKVE